MNIAVFKWLRNFPIIKKLYCVVGAIALLIAFGFFTLWCSLNTLSSVRAFIGAEGLWSKAQKQAIYHLEKYSGTSDENYYKEFQEFLKVPLGDRKALKEIINKEPNWEIARLGFLEGHNHSKDIDGMIKLFNRFKNNSYISKSIAVWIEADSTLSELINVAAELHNEINSGSPSPEKLNVIRSQINTIDHQLTLLEDKFSYTLGEGARWLETLILKTLFFVVLIIVLLGLFLIVFLSYSISKGVNEIIRVASMVAKVDFTERAKVFSNDEIGKLAVAFNKMTDDLQQTINQKIQAENELKKTANDLIRSNNELEQFAYVASHDLQEPLRMVTSYVQLLESRYKDKLDKDAKEFIDFAVDGTNRMKNLIHSLLEYSRVNNIRPFAKINLNLLLPDVLQNLESQIKENNAIIKIDTLPDIDGDAILITQLFQNLISNGIKFKSSKPPEINISGKKVNDEYLFSIKDNGIGIPKEYADKIFLIFQRLHTKDKYPGTGIGLAICKKIVEKHGGKIWFESEIGNGSVFYFTIK